MVHSRKLTLDVTETRKEVNYGKVPFWKSVSTTFVAFIQRLVYFIGVNH